MQTAALSSQFGSEASLRMRTVYEQVPRPVPPGGGLPDAGSVHCLGNGRLCAYGQGPDLVQVFGPPYSAPSLGRIRLEAPDTVTVVSRREPGCAIWTHALYLDPQTSGVPAAEITDFVDADLPCLVRWIRTSLPLQMVVEADPQARVVAGMPRQTAEKLQGGCLFELPPGQCFFHTYPMPFPTFYQLAWQGALTRPANEPGSVIRLACAPGEAVLLLAGGPQYPAAQEALEAALHAGAAPMLARTRRAWQTQMTRRLSPAFPANLPQRELLLQALDDVTVMIKAQQGREGGVLAGYNYHLAYVRDQYGVARGLLQAGLHDEAEQILRFYWSIWQRYGRIHNAQAVGLDGVFHVHENDHVEITGYLIRQAFDLLAAGGNADFMATIFPMLDWAFAVQKAHLVEGMLPFNGDETYVAGGILPRSALNDGSAEATLLFLDGGGKLLRWAEERGLWKGEQLAAQRRVLAETRALYRRNFWVVRPGQPGCLAANNPARVAAAVLPRFRHGVCEGCLVAPARPGGVLWTERSANGRYLCPDCLAISPLPAAAPVVYTLQSVALTPLYLQSDLFEPAELAPTVTRIVESYRASGCLPSRPDEPGGLALGYDFGVLLYALTRLRHPAAVTLHTQTLALLDATGAWAEYYRGNQPLGTRCRQWESAINLEATLDWALSGLAAAPQPQGKAQ
jgi:hypothetical protein